MKNYNANTVLSEVNSMGGVTITGKRIAVEENAGLGIKAWGKVDFLVNHAGYILTVTKSQKGVR